MNFSPWIDNYRSSLGVRPSPHQDFAYDSDDFRKPTFDQRSPTQWTELDEKLDKFYPKVGKPIYHDKFKIKLDVRPFSPNEIRVTGRGNMLTIEAKHKIMKGKHGYVSRHMIEGCTIPKEYDSGRIVCKISSSGILSITAPKINTDGIYDQGTCGIVETIEPSQAETEAHHGEEEISKPDFLKSKL